MKSICLTALLALLTACTHNASKPAPLKDLVIANDGVYDHIILGSLKKITRDIPCSRLVNEIDQKRQKDKDFKIQEHNHFLMMDGIQFTLRTSYNMIPSQAHQSKRYTAAYTKVYEMCQKDQSKYFFEVVAGVLNQP